MYCTYSRRTGSNIFNPHPNPNPNPNPDPNPNPNPNPNQAFGSNIFNICIALGFVWLLQCAMPNCQYGKAEDLTLTLTLT